MPLPLPLSEAIKPQGAIEQDGPLETLRPGPRPSRHGRRSPPQPTPKSRRPPSPGVADDGLRELHHPGDRRGRGAAPPPASKPAAAPTPPVTTPSPCSAPRATTPMRWPPTSPRASRRKPLVRVTPGPRFTFADAHDRVGRRGPDARPPRVRRSRPRPAGRRAGRAAEVLAAEGRVVAILQDRGYADVAAEPREVIVDHADHTVRPAFRIASGHLVQARRCRAWRTRGAPTPPGWRA
jgi:hypothetical protein